MSGLDFNTLIDELRSAVVAPDELPAMWGGEFCAGRLQAFLVAWTGRGDLPWRVWEWISDMQIMHGAGAPPANLQWLERGRLFGDGGDLTLRRDGERFMWHFVGSHASPLPAGFVWDEERGGQDTTTTSVDDAPPFLVSNYWQSRQGNDWRRFRRTALLWGQELQETRNGQIKDLGIWREDRVAGGVNLVYPTLSGQGAEGRVQLVYDEYLQGDVVEAVWWLRLEGFRVKKENSHG